MKCKNNKKEELFARLQEWVQNTAMSEEEANAELEKINYYYNYEWQDLRELRANSLLNHYSKELNFVNIFNKGFTDAMVCGEEIYQCDIVGGEPTLEKINPLKIRIFQAGYSNKIEDADMIVVMEPLRADACNFINTLADGARVVETVKSPYIQLLADTIHMMSNNDNYDDIVKYKDILKHIHIAELQRIMPEDSYSEYIETVLKNLKQNGYDGTVSFESKNGEGLESMKKALALLKNTMNK